jgi:hypothetical protein
MGSAFSIVREGHTKEAATEAILAAALAEGYEIEKMCSSNMNFRSFIKDDDPAPSEHVFIVKGHGIFNIIHEAIKVGKLIHKIKEISEDIDSSDTEEEEVEEEDVVEEEEVAEEAAEKAEEAEEEPVDEVVEEEEAEEEEETEDNVVVDERPVVYRATVHYYCSEADASKKKTEE